MPILNKNPYPRGRDICNFGRHLPARYCIKLSLPYLCSEVEKIFLKKYINFTP